MRKNIVLIGMAGAGKSTLGVLLAKTLGMEFIDTDLLIQRRTGKLLQQMLDEDGMDAFLQAEQEALCSVEPCGAVVATGGSAVYSKKAMAHLKTHSTVVFLDVPFETLQARLANIAVRGVVMKPGQSLRDVYLQRLPLYRKFSDITIDCACADAERCVESIVSAVSAFDQKA